MLAGQVGLPDNVTIGEGAIIGARSGVMSDVPAGEKWFGYPAMRGREFLRSMMTLRHWVSKNDAAGQADENSEAPSLQRDERPRPTRWLSPRPRRRQPTARHSES